MRLQFTQQQHDRQAKARMLAGLIKVNWIKALGMLGLFEDWAANSGKPGEVPEGRLDGPRAPQMLAALLEHRGDPDELVTAFCALDVLEHTPTGLRAKGLEERYGPMFEAAEKRSEAGKKGAAARWKDRSPTASLEQSDEDAPASEPHAPGDADAMRIDAKENEMEEKRKEEEEREALALAAQEQLELEPTEADASAEHPLQALWNRLAHPSLPRWEKLSKTRKRIADARLKERSLGEYALIFERINASPFLLGANDRNWKINLDWLLKPENLQKVLEGNYPAPKPPQNRPDTGPTPPLLRNCSVCDQASEGGAIGEGIFCCYPHVSAFQANAERNGWERPWEHAAEWVANMRAQEVAA